MKKIISILLTLAMLISVCSNVVLAADSQAAITGTYTNIVSKNASIYMDDNTNCTEDEVTNKTGARTFRVRAFLGTGGGSNPDTWSFVAIKWPPKIRTMEKKLPDVTDEATIDNTANTLTSNLTGVTYNLPANNTTGKTGDIISSEAIVLDDYTKVLGTYDGYATKEQAFAAGEKYDKIHILVAATPGYDDQGVDGNPAIHAPSNEGYEADYDTVGWTRSGAFWAYVDYADGTSALEDPDVAGNFKDRGGKANQKASYAFKTNFLKSEQADGRNGMIGKIIPKNADITQENRNGFLTELDSYITTKTSYFSAGSSRVYTAFSEQSALTSPNLIKRNSVFVYEYCIDVDETKELSKITFGNQFGYQRKGVAVLSVMGEKPGITPYYKDLLSEESLNADAAKLYVDANDPEETTGVSYKKKDFLGRAKYHFNEYVAIKWPIQMVEERSAGINEPANRVEITVKDGGKEGTKDDITVVKSILSGTTYSLKRDQTAGFGGKDAVILCPRRAQVGGENTYLPSSVTIPVHNAPYEEIAVLFATAIQSNDGDDKLKVYVNYTDGTKSIPDGDDSTIALKKDPLDPYYYHTMPYHKFMNSVNWGMKHLLAEVQTMTYQLTQDDNTDSAMPQINPVNLSEPGERVTVDGGTAIPGSAILFEVTLGVDKTKTVESVTIETSTAGLGAGDSKNAVRGCAVLSIAGDQKVVANPAQVTEDTCEIEAYTELEGDVYAAIYDKTSKKLVAMEKTPANPSAITNVTVENSAIAADGEYDIKLFIWATGGSFQPLIGATSVNIAQ